jgi:hypothetical protein
MLPETTATIGWVVENRNPSPGYNKNLIITNAKITFTAQLSKELSSQIKYHNPFHLDG